MKRCKLLLFVMILALCMTACSNKSTNANIVDENIDANKILFLRVEYAFYEEIDMYYTILTSIDNSGNMDVYTLQLKKDSDIIKNIKDPNAMLLLMQETDEEELYTINNVSIEKLKIAYEKTFDIKDKLTFNHALIYGDEYDPNYNNYLFGFSYINNEEYVPTKYYSSNTISSQIADETGYEVIEYLYSVFR